MALHEPEMYERIAREVVGFTLLSHAYMHTGCKEILEIRSKLQSEMTHDAFMIFMDVQKYWKEAGAQ